MNQNLVAFAFGALLSALAVLPAAASSPLLSPAPSPTATRTSGPPYANMEWREIGPAEGGRVSAVAGSNTDPSLYYVGSAGGGVWKSSNSAQTWDPVFAKEAVGSIGAVTIDPTDNATVWVGTGEDNPRNDVTYGNGVYKTTDGGEHWQNMGLAATKYISRIVVDPRNHDHVLVAAQGDVFNDSPDRGVYVTWDSGKTWTKTLYSGPEAGASDLAMDPQNPSVLYAGVWQFQRRPWTFTSGGPQDGLYKSTDGGRNWKKLGGNGLPTDTIGRIGLAIAPSNGDRVYALIESQQGILWRSDDGGDHWVMVSNNTLVDQRPFYFTHIAVDPKNPDVVYGVSTLLSKSTDGGNTFTAIAEGAHTDYHAIWIAPNDSKRIITGEDGGYTLTVDGGDNWFFSANLPIGQFYRIGLSDENPYWVCGGLQDNWAWCAPSNTQDPSGIQNKVWIAVTSGDGEWVIPDPIDPNFIWADAQSGLVTVTNKVTKDNWFVQPYLQTASESFDNRTAKVRWSWESPIAFAPWDGHIAWIGANVIFQTTDRGLDWRVISPDLTRDVKDHQAPSGGPITHDVTGAEASDAILDIEGSKVRKGEIWVGTDDGLVQLTLDGGAHWRNITPPNAPEYGRFSSISPSPLRDGTAYAINDGHYVGDNSPYVFVTHDFGTHWNLITTGLPRAEWARSIAADIHNPNLVYLGTEEGLWISYNGGTTWESFKNNLPTVSVHDIRMQSQFDDLAIATHGRSIYIMDDMTPIQDLQTAVEAGTYMFAIRTSYQYNTRQDNQGTYTDYVAANPPSGVVIDYYQSEAQKAPPILEIVDGTGKTIRAYKGTHDVHNTQVPWVPNNAGLNRFVWDWAIDGPLTWYGASKESHQAPDEGPVVPPGQYIARLTLGSKVFTERFVVKADPRTIYSQAQLVECYNFERHGEALLTNVDAMLNNLDAVKKSIDRGVTAARSAGDTAAENKLEAIEAARIGVFKQLTANFQNSEDLVERAGTVREDLETIMSFDVTVVTPAMRDFARRVEGELSGATANYATFVKEQIPAVNELLRALGIDAVKLR